jgi:hypothetical protein
MTEWDRCRRWLLPALEPGCASESELVEDLQAGRAQLWPGEASALVTQCVVDELGPCLHVWLAGGSLDEILAMRTGVEAWGRFHGCQRVTINGRKGWARALRRCGYAWNGEELERRL